MPTSRTPKTTNTTQKPLSDQDRDLGDVFANLSITSNNSTQRSPLLALPAELRTEIYTTTLLSTTTTTTLTLTGNTKTFTTTTFPLLQACRQINMEATPILYQRPLTFTSQSHLFTWLAQSSVTDLKRVRTLSIRLTDINLSSLFDVTPSKRHARPNAWSLYQRELEALDRALLSLPGLVDFTIIPPERNHSQLLRGMYFAFLGMIPERLPRLRNLTIHDCGSLAEKIPSLSKVANLVFDQPRRSAGAGSSSSEEEFRRMAGFTPRKRDVAVKMEVDED